MGCCHGSSWVVLQSKFDKKPGRAGTFTFWMLNDFPAMCSCPQMRQMPQKHVIKIAINGSFLVEVWNQERAFVRQLRYYDLEAFALLTYLYL